MGVGHLSPSGTRNQFEKIVEYKGNHTDVTEIEERWKAEDKETAVIQHFTQNYGFTECEEWITRKGIDEKVVAETRHGVELRILYHPSGTTVYFYLVATTGEFQQENLAIQHLETYYTDLKQVMQDVYGNLRRKTTAWTSEKIEVEEQ